MSDDLGAGCQRDGKDDADDIDVLGMVFHPGQLAVDTEFQVIDIAAAVLVGEIEVCLAVAEALFTESGTVIFISVGPAVDPDIGQGIGGVIDVLDADMAVEGMGAVGEGDVDGIVDFLLPVLCAGEGGPANEECG